MTAKVVCEVSGLSKKFGRAAVIKNVSFKIFSRQFILLTGENGSGKTSLLRMLSTLSTPSQGTITYFEHAAPPSASSLANIRQRIGYLASGNALNPELSLQENLDLILEFMHIPKSDGYLSELLDLWSLGHVARKPCKFLSKGELQKGNIIRSTLHRPSLLFWDEPQNGLDSRSQERLATTLERLKTLDCAMVCTSHFAASLEKYFDAHWVLEKGNLRT